MFNWILNYQQLIAPLVAGEWQSRNEHDRRLNSESLWLQNSA